MYANQDVLSIGYLIPLHNALIKYQLLMHLFVSPQSQVHLQTDPKSQERCRSIPLIFSFLRRPRLASLACNSAVRGMNSYDYGYSTHTVKAASTPAAFQLLSRRTLFEPFMTTPLQFLGSRWKNWCVVEREQCCCWCQGRRHRCRESL